MRLASTGVVIGLRPLATPVITSEPSEPLEPSARFSAGREHVHAGGHGVPSDKEFRALLKEFVAGAMCD